MSSLIKILETLKDAKHIDLCMYRFTLPQLGDLLIRLKKRGALIRIIVDNPGEPIMNDQIPILRQAGIEVREEMDVQEARERPKMHHKFVIVDNDCCLIGSFNWTYNAVAVNRENVVKSYDANMVKPLIAEFQKMWNR